MDFSFYHRQHWRAYSFLVLQSVVAYPESTDKLGSTAEVTVVYSGRMVSGVYTTSFIYFYSELIVLAKPARGDHPGPKHNHDYQYNLMRRTSFAAIVGPIQQNMSPCSHETLERDRGPFSFEPDFFLHVPPSLPSYRGKEKPEAALAADPLQSLPFVAQMMTYSGHRTDLETSIAAMLSATPGMILRR